MPGFEIIYQFIGLPRVPPTVYAFVLCLLFCIRFMTGIIGKISLCSNIFLPCCTIFSYTSMQPICDNLPFEGAKWWSLHSRCDFSLYLLFGLHLDQNFIYCLDVPIIITTRIRQMLSCAPCRGVYLVKMNKIMAEGLLRKIMVQCPPKTRINSWLMYSNDAWPFYQPKCANRKKDTTIEICLSNCSTLFSFSVCNNWKMYDRRYI